MKRSEPPKRRTRLRSRAALGRSAGLERTGWGAGARKPLNAVSARRRAEGKARAQVRAEVLARDKGCKAYRVAPGLCEWRPDRAPLEVHEVVPRARDSGAWLDPDLCIAVCPGHHDWITEHPEEATALGLMARADHPGVG